MTEKEEVRSLWKLCFEDGDDFLDLYFSRRYSDDVNVCLRDASGRMASSLQMLPYGMTFCGGRLRMSYVSGACTRPDCRGQGLMRRLLQVTHRRMFAAGTDIAALIPADDALFLYYAKSGYVPSFRYAIVAADAACALGGYAVADETVALSDELYALFDSLMMERPCCVQHTREDLLAVAEDLRLASGRMLVARMDSVAHGLAFVAYPSGRPVVKELLAVDEAARRALLSAAAGGAGVVDVVSPSADGRCLGMARIINPLSVLTAYARRHPDAELHMALSDSDIAENCGSYMVKGGLCVRTTGGRGYTPYTIGELTSLLLADEHPYMSLMMD